MAGASPGWGFSRSSARHRNESGWGFDQEARLGPASPSAPKLPSSREGWVASSPLASAEKQLKLQAGHIPWEYRGDSCRRSANQAWSPLTRPHQAHRKDISALPIPSPSHLAWAAGEDSAPGTARTTGAGSSTAMPWTPVSSSRPQQPFQSKAHSTLPGAGHWYSWRTEGRPPRPRTGPSRWAPARIRHRGNRRQTGAGTSGERSTQTAFPRIPSDWPDVFPSELTRTRMGFLDRRAHHQPFCQ